MLDEAYLPFVLKSWDSLELQSMENVVLLRSMTKDHALTGLRLGYLMASANVAGLVRKFQYSWSVNSLAQLAGLAALGDPEHVAKGREVVNQGKEFLREAASSLGLACPDSAANFLLFEVGHGPPEFDRGFLFSTEYASGTARHSGYLSTSSRREDYGREPRLGQSPEQRAPNRNQLVPRSSH